MGTPRMVFDKTGALANVKRHDYLPFGEELSSGQGVRTTTLGYGAVDNIRQKFTSQERDNETGLDYMHARYFASAQGRFTSADSVAGSIGNPQSLNRYAYVGNNPMNFSDPTGHDRFSASSNGFAEAMGEEGGGCLIALLPKGQLDSSSFHVESIEVQTVYDSRYIFERASRIVPREKLVRSSDIECLVSDLKASGLFENVKAELVRTGPDTRKLLLTCTYRTFFDRLVINGLEIEDVPYIDRVRFRKELNKSGVKAGTPISKYYYRSLEERINKAFRAALPQNLANDFSGWTCITLRSAGAEEIRVIVSPDYGGCDK